MLTKTAPKAIESRLVILPLLRHLLILLGLAHKVLHGSNDHTQGQEAAHREDHTQCHHILRKDLIACAAVEDTAAESAAPRNSRMMHITISTTV